MQPSAKSSPLHRMINPESIAFFGASNSFSSMGTNQLTSILKLGFAGNIYPVHPKETRVLGLKAFQNVQDIPEVPDLAVLVLPTRIVPEILEQCARKGIQYAIVVSGGFREVGGKGVQLEQMLVDIADRYGMRFLGPNCLGIANPHNNLNTTFLPFTGQPGFIGMASQSGSFITQMFDYLSRIKMGFSTAVSVGNEANIDIVDCMEYLAGCPHTKVICLYIEAIRKGRRFIEAARAIAQHKPIVAYYVGGSESGKQASLSHTGALSGPDNLYDGVFRQSHILRAGSIQEMFDICSVLGCAPLPGGNRVVIQTHSGGPGATAADACNRLGLEIPLMPETLRDKISEFIPHTGSVSNPLDITFSKDPMDFFNKIPSHLLESDVYDILLMYLLLPRHLFRNALTEFGVPEDRIDHETAKLIGGISDMIKTLSVTYNKPIVGFTFHSNSEPIVKELRERSIPVLFCPHRAARAIAALVQYAAWRRTGK
jgi:acyl-CoA synthetase (NDP forming)